MKHLGDITKLSGYVVPAVDVVIGGSPCQGLSVAGKQAGLKDERSGLFIEQIRLVKEMRKADAARGKQMTLFDQDTWSGKMSPEPSALTKAETLRRFSKKPSASLNRKPPCSCPCERMAHKRMPRGRRMERCVESSRRSVWGTPDKPLPQRRRRISLVADLEEEPHPKYYLSGKACRGILTRAERRQKEIPALLKAALEMQAEQEWSELDGTESQNRK